MITIKDDEYFQKLLLCLHGSLLGVKSLYRLPDRSDGLNHYAVKLYGNLFMNVSCGAAVSAEFYQPLLQLCCDPQTAQARGVEISYTPR